MVRETAALMLFHPQAEVRAGVARVLAEVDGRCLTPETLRRLIEETLTLDPRPAYKGEADGRAYGMKLQGWDVRWRLAGKGMVLVTDILGCGQPP